MKLKLKQLTPPQLLGQEQWNAMIKTQVENAMGVHLAGAFTPAKYAPGFCYGIKSTFYNPDTLTALDSLVTETDGITVMDGAFSTFYENVIEHLKYGLSTKDQDAIREEQTKYESKVETIIQEYQNCGIDKDPIEYPTVMDIMQRVTEITGLDYNDPALYKKYAGASSLWTALSEYGRLAQSTAQKQGEWVLATRKLEAIMEHIKKPSEANGGLRVDQKGSYKVGWEGLPETETLLKNLQSGAEFSFTMTAQDFKEKDSTFHMSNSVSVTIPVLWLFTTTMEHDSEYSLSKYASTESRMDIKITFKGVTQIPVNPAKLLPSNEKGWLDEDVIEQAAKKSGKDETGYCLNGGEYNPAALFGKKGKLRRMSTLVISQQPIISLHFEKFDCAGLSEKFSEKSKASFSFLGGLISGSHENDYSYENYKYDAKAQTIDVTIMPPALGTSGSFASQTAFVLGGVVKHYE